MATVAPDKNFSGFPIPAAAGTIASITLFMLWLDEGQHTIGRWKYALPPLMLFLSFMMFSKFRYPSFKAVNWRTQQSAPRFLFVIAVLAVTVKFYQWMAAVLFLAYLLYGFLRPFLSPKRRREIEEEIGEEEVSEESDRRNALGGLVPREFPDRAHRPNRPLVRTPELFFRNAPGRAPHRSARIRRAAKVVTVR